ncbi:ditrans,polycis-polyprenyl diphosphate synthase [Chamberlinius hualienensis]
MAMIYRFLLIGLHFVFSLFIFALDIIRGLKKAFSDFVCFRLPAQAQNSQEETVNQLTSTLKSFTKLPEHVVLLLGEDGLSFPDITNIIKWCMTAGIRHISVYDHEGVVKKSINSLVDMLESNRKNGPGDDKIHYCVRDYRNISNSSTSNGDEKNTCFVNVLSNVDGRGGIVRSAVDIAHNLTQKSLEASSIKLLDLENKLINEELCPYPNLLFGYGKIRSTIGFLPWHLHLTEILSFETHHQFSLELFIQSLSKYSNCEQRLGK